LEGNLRLVDRLLLLQVFLGHSFSRSSWGLVLLILLPLLLLLLLLGGRGSGGRGSSVGESTILDDPLGGLLAAPPKPGNLLLGLGDVLS